ncbi:MAG TPA: TOPRIM nucleotidyl transferase/hydrolase domain-containing protein [Actinomycetota bacterium]|nr:TOPRIM nucleotidyl transferase/hydrolase domain-containing protein [Actinomycetota bacterium]
MRPTDSDTWKDRYLGVRGVALVEGVSDQLALEALAKRRGRDLEAEGIAIIPVGGSKNVDGHLAVFGPQGLDVTLAGLCDVAEVDDFRRGLERTGPGRNLSRADMERIGFYVCVEDLEDELIRALGSSTVERIVEAHGEMQSFRTFQKQPAQRGRQLNDQLRRFMGTRAGRKAVYAPLLVEALDIDRVPRPLDGVLSHL